MIEDERKHCCSLWQSFGLDFEMFSKKRVHRYKYSFITHEKQPTTQIEKSQSRLFPSKTAQ